MGIACCSWTRRISRCPTRRSCRLTSGSRASRKKDVGFPSPIRCCCSMPAPDWRLTRSRRRCGRTRCRWRRARTSTWPRGIWSSATTASEAMCTLHCSPSRGVHVSVPGPPHAYRRLSRRDRPCINSEKCIKAKASKGLPRSRWVKSLGETDQIVEWFKPASRPKWMTAAQWKQLPERLMVREVRRTIQRPGFRPVTLTIVTTLLDAKKYPATELFTLRLRRWDVETDIRHLKTTMGIEVLQCKSVEGAVEETMGVPDDLQPGARGDGEQRRSCQKVAVSRISFASALHWMRLRPRGRFPSPAGGRASSSQSDGAARHQAAAQAV